jgi:hypothetical protein
MQDSFDVHGSADPDRATLLDFERLDVYRVALEFQALASSIQLPHGRRELRDQLDRAALSIVLNTAEGGATS